MTKSTWIVRLLLLLYIYIYIHNTYICTHNYVHVCLVTSISFSHCTFSYLAELLHMLVIKYTISIKEDTSFYKSQNFYIKFNKENEVLMYKCDKRTFVRRDCVMLCYSNNFKVWSLDNKRHKGWREVDSPEQLSSTRWPNNVGFFQNVP